MNELLTITDLSKRYDGFALRDVSLSVPAGSVVGLVGANGAGKTTVIKAALGLIRADGGKVRLFGTAAPRDAATKQRIGVVFDTCALPEEITVAAAGSLMRSVYGRWDQAAFKRCLGEFGLPEDKKVSDLSRGMSMKLSLACALSHGAELLVLDEATAGLDPIAREEVLGMLREFMADKGRGILMSSHITSDLEKIADYVVCIKAGRIAFSVEKDAITDVAGVAQCNAAEFDSVAESSFFAPGEMRFIRQPYGTAILVPDRFAFGERFPRIALDRADIDGYLNLVLKGEIR